MIRLLLLFVMPLYNASDGFYIKVVETREYPVTSETNNNNPNEVGCALTSSSNVVEKSAVLWDRIAPLVKWEVKSVHVIMPQAKVYRFSLCSLFQTIKRGEENTDRCQVTDDTFFI